MAADAFSAVANTQIVPDNAIPDGWEGLDIGPKAEAEFAKVIAESKTILWNGPVGVFEIDKFAKGSKAIAEAIVKATKNGAFSLIGGGDSVACINKFGMADQVSYVSTGGGALLRGLDQLVGSYTGIDVHVAETPLDCVATGAGLVLDNMDLLAEVVADAERKF